MRHSAKEEAIILHDAGISQNTLSPSIMEDLQDAHLDLDLDYEKMTVKSVRKRSYHTWDHVLDVLSALNDAHADGVISDREQPIVTMAALFHDSYYRPGAPEGDNENNSIEYMKKMLGKPRGTLTRVINLIGATALHGKLERPLDSLTSLFMDADLAGLGCPWARFVVQNDEVDEELMYVPNRARGAVKAGRIKFLEGMLNKQTVYLSNYFGRRYEWQARYNMQRLLLLVSEE